MACDTLFLNIAGLHVLCSESVQIPWFDSVFADIGDEQSLTQSLSTFSGHLKHISVRKRVILESVSINMTKYKCRIVKNLIDYKNFVKIFNVYFYDMKHSTSISTAYCRTSSHSQQVIHSYYWMRCGQIAFSGIWYVTNCYQNRKGITNEYRYQLLLFLVGWCRNKSPRRSSTGDVSIGIFCWNWCFVDNCYNTSRGTQNPEIQVLAYKLKMQLMNYYSSIV